VSQKTRDHIFNDKLNYKYSFTKNFFGYMSLTVFLFHTSPTQCIYFTLRNCWDLNIMNLALNCQGWFSYGYNIGCKTVTIIFYLLFNYRFRKKQ